MHVICWLEGLKGRDHLGDIDVDGRIILKWISEKYGMMVLTNVTDSDRIQWWIF
jgi:hypothetical protein